MLKDYDNVRQIEAHLNAEGIRLDIEVDPTKPSGPGFIILKDPEDNTTYMTSIHRQSPASDSIKDLFQPLVTLLALVYVHGESAYPKL